MNNIAVAKWLIFAGLGLVAVGVLFWLGLPFGKLPGDIRIKGEKFGIYFPIVTCLIISVLLTLLLNFIFWLLRK